MHKITHAACQGSPHWLLRHQRNKIKTCVVAEYSSTLPYATPCLAVSTAFICFDSDYDSFFQLCFSQCLSCNQGSRFVLLPYS